MALNVFLGLVSRKVKKTELINLLNSHGIGNFDTVELQKMYGKIKVF